MSSWEWLGLPENRPTFWLPRSEIKFSDSLGCIGGVGERADSQSNYIGRLPLSLESNGGVAAALLNLERYELGLDYYLRYAELINAVTPAEILETAQRYLSPDCLAIATAGTFEASK